MGFNETADLGKYNTTTISVSNSSQISQRTSAIVSKLKAPSDDSTERTKPIILILSASTKTLTKLVSIVEIAKREMLATGQKCYQYSALSGNMIEIERRPSNKEGSQPLDGIEDDDENAFQMMGEHLDSATKKRNVPVLTIYLSSTSIPELKAAFGCVHLIGKREGPPATS